MDEIPAILGEIPTEIWIRIADYVPDNDLFRLASVNHLFFELVVDRKYRQLVIDDDRPSTLIGKLSKLEQDPMVAARARSLTIHPKAVRSACVRSKKPKKGRMQTAQHANWPDAFRLRAERFLIEEDIELADRFLDALSKLREIEEFCIEWKQGVEGERSFCLPLLAAIWPLCGRNLRVIRLDMMLGHLCDMVVNVDGLDHVQELELNFTCNPARFGPWSGPGYEAKYTFKQLATFLNRLALSLQSLTIFSIGHLNFSWLYSDLVDFPQLTNLGLLVPCDPRHVVDPTGLHRFLRAHRNIKRFNFAPQFCCHQSALPPESSSGFTSTEGWLDRIFARLSFPYLDKLELGLNILGSGGKRVMTPVPYLGKAAVDVRCLSIAGCFISLDDLRLVLSSFSTKNPKGTSPKTLILEVHVLDVSLLDLLAELLPNLERLDLTYRWITTFGHVDHNVLVQQLQSKEYPNWKLWQLVLRCSRRNDDSRWPSQQAILRCVPGLRS